MTNAEITATIKEASLCDYGHRSPNIFGKIYGDSKHRFEDGTKIYTSTIVKDLGNGLYQTRNSLYKVEFKKEEVCDIN